MTLGSNRRSVLAESERHLSTYTHAHTEQSQDPFWPKESGSGNSTCPIVSVIFFKCHWTVKAT